MLSAIITAKISPTYLTLSFAIGGCAGSRIGVPSLESTCQPHGILPTSISVPTNILTTPFALEASFTSILKFA